MRPINIELVFLAKFQIVTTEIAPRHMPKIDSC